MKVLKQIEQALEAAVASGEAPGYPPKLAGAIRHAVFPGGARIRPQLSLAVAQACGCDDLPLAMAAAISIELLHCASLVHDDLPCFDNADTRRGQPSVHKAYGENLAVLTGDALIVLAFQTLARAGENHPERLPHLLGTVASGVGMPLGIVAGQAWECESKVSLTDYQRAKTGALFVAASAAGAQASGSDSLPWRALGDWLGEAYQVADDIRDVLADPQLLGKPVGQDIALGRPSAAIDLGLGGAIAHFEKLIDAAADSVPQCATREAMRQLVRQESERLVPRSACDQFRTATSLSKPLSHPGAQRAHSA
jgi:geranylgeranyl diphosphate synthase type II